jgi:hypothetical protein
MLAGGISRACDRRGWGAEAHVVSRAGEARLLEGSTLALSVSREEAERLLRTL